ncbi:MAG: A/G-specific adenine glycosylase, partial [Selenomonadales bacterium]|nr:A/G-specific adenine glycosylase [Selenomonadales bacterium]
MISERNDEIYAVGQLSRIVSPLLAWYAKQARDLPWRRSRDPYAIWVSEIMLQQTRVEAVKPYFTRFMAELPTVKHLAEVDETRLLKLWEGLGYYSRARNLKKAAEMVVREYDGRL